MTTGSLGRGREPASDEQTREAGITNTRSFESAGLTAGEVERRQKQYGFNLLPRFQRPANVRGVDLIIRRS